MIPFRLLMLVGLVRLLVATNKPFLCAGIYAGLATAGALVTGAGAGALIVGGLSFVLAGLYFWLLNRFEESFLFWIILILGLFIGVF